MNNVFHFFSHSTSRSEAIIFAAFLVICWNIENIAGLTLNYKKWNHALLNSHFIITGILPQLLMGFLIIRTMHWTHHHHFGLLYDLPFMKNKLVFFTASFILLDFGEYIYHVIMHKYKRLWMFHAVHHSDDVVDVSTTLREHPGENLIRNSFTIIWIFLSGVVFWAFFIRQLIQIVSNMLVHMNYRLPEKVDAILGLVFITPNLHQVHHHYQKPYTDSNYGDVLSIWDRMFGTFCRLPYDSIVFGVDDFMDKKDHSKYISLMKMPFSRSKKE